MSKKIVLITGANKGLGFAAARAFAKEHSNLHVVLTARNATLGEAAINKLNTEGINNVEFLQLDVTSKDSIKSAAVEFKKRHQGLDILILNAGNKKSHALPLIIFTGVAINGGFGYKTSLEQLNVNYFGVVDVFEAFFPLVRAGGRVVNVSSSLGYITKFPENLEKQFSDPNLTQVIKLSYHPV
jgi:NAD(P)-dependent dehydrogenase (short-subunit alcohol dehydrogenase family)